MKVVYLNETIQYMDDLGYDILSLIDQCEVKMYGNKPYFVEIIED